MPPSVTKIQIPRSARPRLVPVQLLALLALVCGAALSLHAGQPPTSAPLFSLPRWPDGPMVPLTNFAGQIVVLDFFAYWCVPCRRATAEIEQGIRQHYAARDGNPQGLPVQVLSVNIEPDHPELTRAFVQRTAAGFVLDDPESRLLTALGGAATPFVVIIDGSQATAAQPNYRLVYRHAGFAGTSALRSVIDPIGAPSAETKDPGPGAPRRTAPVASAVGSALEGQGASAAHRAEAAFDALLASDVQVTGTSLDYRAQRGATQWQLGYAHASYDLKYRPYRRFDFLGADESVRRQQNSARASVKQRLGPVELNAGGGIYDGFTDFRSLWLANYYQQQFSFVPGYRPPQPRGFSVRAGARWEYQPTTGFIEATFRYGNDAIAPGYELEPASAELRHGRSLLHTHAPALRFENILTERIRAQHELELRITSGREPRYVYRGSLKLALHERWVAHASVGYAHEDPTLRAWFVGGTLEVDLTSRWSANLSGLYYRDTGEIENSLFISTAAPGLRTAQLGPGLRYQGEQVQFSVSVSPLWARYDPVQTGTRPFTNLYRDRDWLYVHAALSIAF